MKIKQTITALALVLAMILPASAAGMLLQVGAAEDTPDSSNGSIVYVANDGSTKPIYTLVDGRNYTLQFTFSLNIDKLTPAQKTNLSLKADSSTVKDEGSFAKRSGSTLKLETVKVDDTKVIVTATITNMICTDKKQESLVLYLSNLKTTKESYTFPNQRIDVSLSSYLEDKNSSGGSGGSGDSDYGTLSSDIVVENVMFLDSQGDRIDVVTEDTPAFTVEVLYSDIGLRRGMLEGFDVEDAEIQAFITSSSGFKLGSSNRGTVRSVMTNDEYPRYRATFRNVTFDGTSNTFNFRVQYIIEDQDVKGEASVTAYQAKLNSEEGKNKIPPPTPYIIVSQYSYGENQIEAGSEFKLDITLRNTSSDLPLENVLMTVTPPEDLAVASASNTVYIPNLAANGSMQHSIALRAKPTAAASSHSVQIDFNYQYLTETERKEGKTTENIAIPVTQIDRFSVDPITELSEMVMVGEEALVTVSFINRGKSPTYNISGKIEGGDTYSGQSVHFGNLEAGKSDSMDFVVTPTEAGTINGEVVIQYEDENNNVKEIKEPFSITVEEMYIPPMDPTEGMEDMDGMENDQAGPSSLQIVLSILGGLMIAIPIALYLFKRVKAKGNEELDEDF